MISLADDTSVFIEGHEYDMMIEILNNEVMKIDTWLECNGLVININKTHYMVFYRATFKSIDKDINIPENNYTCYKCYLFKLLFYG